MRIPKYRIDDFDLGSSHINGSFADSAGGGYWLGIAQLGGQRIDPTRQTQIKLGFGTLQCRTDWHTSDNLVIGPEQDGVDACGRFGADIHGLRRCGKVVGLIEDVDAVL